MINLSPINSKIRAELHRREKFLNREKPPINSTNTEDGKSKTTYNNMFNKSTWVRMVSIRSNDTVVIGGGLLQDDGSINAVYDDIYGPRTNDDENFRGFKPIPGIKDIGVEYMGNLSTLRSGTINWTCWDIDDIERFTPHFLKHGNAVLLEWGWSYDKNPIDLFNIDLIRENKVTLNEIYDIINQRMVESSGNYDAMFGIVKNYGWDVRDDGGADCTTEIITLGIDMLKQKIMPTTSVNIGEEIKKDQKIVKTKSLDFSSFIDNVDAWLVEQAHRIQGTSTGEEPDRIKGVYINPTLEFVYDEDALDYVDLTNPYTSNIPSGRRLPKVVYVSWGWLEDNVLSRYLSKVKNGEEVISSIRSIQPSIDNHGGVIKRNDGSTVYESVKVLNHPYLISSDINLFLLPGQIVLTEDDRNRYPDLSKIDEKVEAFGIDQGDGVDKTVGNLRNMMLNWFAIRDLFREANDLNTALTRLFNRLQEESGIWDFKVVSSPYNSSQLMVIDQNYALYQAGGLTDNPSTLNENWNDANGQLYVFDTMGRNSIVKGHGLNGTVPSEMALAAMYSANSSGMDLQRMSGFAGFSLGKLSKSGTNQALGDIKPAWLYGNIRFGTNDPYDYSEKFGMNTGPNIKINTKTDSTAEDTQPVEYTTNSTSKKIISKLKFTSKQEEDFKKVIDETRRIDYLYTDNGTLRNNNLEKTIMKFLVSANTGKDTKSQGSMWNTSIMVNLKLDLTIDGISGVYPGNCFSSVYIPSTMKDKVVFQITGVRQELDGNSWTTSFDSIMRISMKHIKDQYIYLHKGETEVVDTSQQPTQENADRLEESDTAEFKDGSIIDQWTSGQYNADKL